MSSRTEIMLRALAMGLAAVAIAATSTGCGPRPLMDPSADVNNLAHNEGLVYGSFLVVVDEESPVPSGKYEWYGPEDRRTHYELHLHRHNARGQGIASSNRYLRTRAWEVVPFVATLREGRYDFGRMNMYLGSQSRVSKRLVDTTLDFRFTVRPQEATYLGRMIVAVPPKMIPRKTQVSTWVEDFADEDAKALGWYLTDTVF